MDAKCPTAEQEAVKTNLEKKYQESDSKFKTVIKDKKPIQTENDKKLYLADHITYLKETHKRLTAELLVSRNNDKIDLDNRIENFTKLKDRGGVNLREVLYD
ncbi:hypothetical protein [Leptospira jelokensis]|uniref:hypothetical protein n=1 Tax=Leptospira jelokensis TaxID=2484931 RepID=UPI0010914A6E|nr:hypothetical protein [Leptospira jelokensis]TGM02404.1 hypothetical protein EHQ79_13620 [Leptospira jelokensis]